MEHIYNIILQTGSFPPKDSWATWILGPHLLGLVYLLIGSIQYKYPPKKINNWYGYRTYTSQRDQETWDEANRFSAIYMIKAGVYTVILGIALVALLNFIPMPGNVHFFVLIFFFIAGALAAPISLIVVTEKHLKKLFGDK